MDLLFKRYASPFLLLDNFILTNSLSEFIDDFFRFVGEEIKEKSEWEFFLHKVYDKSWKEFVDEMEMFNDNPKIDLGATIIKSKNMLNHFTPK